MNKNLSEHTTGTTPPSLCTCEACHYTFNPSLYHSKFRIPKRCPNCGKMKVDGRTAVREATEEEIEEYKRVQKKKATDIRHILAGMNKFPCHQLLPLYSCNSRSAPAGLLFILFLLSGQPPDQKISHKTNLPLHFWRGFVIFDFILSYFGLRPNTLIHL